MKVLGYNCVFFPSLDFALNCQVCQKYGAGICETAEDNGVSMECPPDLNACWYIYEGKVRKDSYKDKFSSIKLQRSGMKSSSLGNAEQIWAKVTALQKARVT